MRGSADELLDAGAHSRSRCDAPLGRPRDGRGGLGPLPDAQLGIGPAIEDGFYYDFLLPRPLTPDDLAAIEAGMRASVAADHKFIRDEVPFENGRAFFETRSSRSRSRSSTT